MHYWRIGFAILLLLLAGPSLLTPLLDLARLPDAWSAWDDYDRLLSLTCTTTLLVAGTVLLAVPLGTALAVFLYRFDLPGRAVLHFLILLCLFVPLALLVSGWEAFLRSVGMTRQPGLLSAILLHAIHALPWVVCIVGVGLSAVERPLEEDALTVVSTGRVLLAVTLRRSRVALLAAAVWVAAQASSEIVITNLYQVRTFAEEVYTQFVTLDPTSGGTDPELLSARALVVCLPNLLATGFLLFLVGRKLHRLSPPTARPSAPLLFSPCRGQRYVGTLVALIVVALAAIPLVGLLRQAGTSGVVPSWSLTSLLTQLGASFQSARISIVSSLLVAVGVGFQTALLALILCWLARESRLLFGMVAALAFLALTLPGPVMGLGMKTTILKLVLFPNWGWLNTLLYDGPSFAPVVWVQTVRLLPFALALLWPTMRMLPRPLFASARLDGARPSQELVALVLPLMGRPFLRTTVVLTALSLGEIGASKLVSTPGAATFCEQLFMQLHYSSEGDLAARSLLFLTALAGLAVLYSILSRMSLSLTALSEKT